MSAPPGTVRRATINKLRARYNEQWSRQWPEDDDYLAELWREVQVKNVRGNTRIPAAECYDRCLMLMRENHPFDPAAPATGAAGNSTIQ
jgi:hypothetical protein